MPDTRKQYDNRYIWVYPHDKALVSHETWVKHIDFRFAIARAADETLFAGLPFHEAMFHPKMDKVYASITSRFQRYTVRKDGRLRYQPKARVRWQRRR